MQVFNLFDELKKEQLEALKVMLGLCSGEAANYFEGIALGVLRWKHEVDMTDKSLDALLQEPQ